MKTWIAFFRGINVGGSNLLPMKRLSALMQEAGCRDVQTYIQSGNVILRSSISDASRLALRVGAVVSAGCGFAPRVLVLGPEELKKAMAANPFPRAAANPKSLHLFFLADRPKEPDLEALRGVQAKSESFLLRGKVFYLHTPEGFGRSKLAGRVERCLGVEATARNWRTVSAIVELAAAYN